MIRGEWSWFGSRVGGFVEQRRAEAVGGGVSESVCVGSTHLPHPPRIAVPLLASRFQRGTGLVAVVVVPNQAAQVAFG